MALTVTSALGIISCLYNSLKDGIAITIKIKHGIKVHTISIKVLWVVFDGLGFLLSLNLLPDGVTGNTSGFGPEESRFDP